MATVQLALTSERANRVFISGSRSNIAAGDNDDLMALPVNFGDCWLWSGRLIQTGMTTLVSSPSIYQPLVTVCDASNNLTDPVPGWSSYRAVLLGAGAVVYVSELVLGEAILWRSTECLRFQYASLDTGALSDPVFQFRVSRMRNQGLQ